MKKEKHFGNTCLLVFCRGNSHISGYFGFSLRKGGRLKLALINTVISIMMLAVSLISFVYFNEKYFIQNKKEEEW